jgi:hypothetical protein
MEVQARSVDPAFRKACQDKCKNYKSSLKSVKADLDRLAEGADRSDLMSMSNKEAQMQMDQQKRLISTTDKLQKGKDTLEATRLQLLETEEVGETGVCSQYCM